MVHQHFRLVPPFTVAENVILGEHRPEARRFVIQPDRDREAGRGARAPVRARHRSAARGSGSSRVGEQQRVEILKALYREARILILDEPTAVLTPQEAEVLFETLRAMAAEGRTVIFISHKLHEVKAVADRVTVLRGGRAVATLATADATARELAALMVGREVELARRIERAAPPGVEAVLEVEGLQRSRRPRRGGSDGRRRSPSAPARSSAIAGVAGNGQRELAEAITGMRPATGGRVTVGGPQPAAGRPTLGDCGRDRARAGGPARHRRRLEPDHRRQLGAQVVPPPRRSLAGRCCAGGAIRSTRVELIHRYGVLDARARSTRRATCPAGTCRSSSSAASSRASRRC